MAQTKVHLLRHGEVDNPNKVLYGRLPGFGLSPLGHDMAHMAYENFVKNRNITYMASSPLLRTRQTAQPSSDGLGLEVELDERLIEAENHLQGLHLPADLKNNPKYWKYLRNPLKPSWGESYTKIAERMQDAVLDAAEKAGDGEALLVSHQLPIWMARVDAEAKSKAHLPTKRECSLASVTTLTVNDGTIVQDVEYSEPAAELLPLATTIPGA